MAKDTASPPGTNALRYALNEREYKILHDYLLKRAPQRLRNRAYTPEKYSATCQASDDYHAATTRSALRVFVTVGTGLKGWEFIKTRILSRQKESATPRARRSILTSPNVRLAFSLSTILYLHRVLHRFFLRLRLRLLAEKTKELRKRYPRIAGALTSRYAPAVGASLAGLSLGIYPKDQLRVTFAIYVAARALEYLYNAVEAEGYLHNKPKWLGSWLFFPLAQGQLLHAFVFDRDCFPGEYGDFILKHSSYYIQARPKTASPSLSWPGTYQTVDALAEIARLRWPSFISPIIFPNNASLLPPSIDSSIASITSSAHPLLHSHSLSCALLHPSNPSCLHAFLSQILLSSTSLLRVFTLIFSAMSLPRYKAFLKSPLRNIDLLSKQILRTTFIISSAISVAWASICLFQQTLPRNLIPQWRFFLGGFLGGSFAYFDRSGGRSTAIYAARTSADSLWKVGVKKRWWKGIKGGDLMVFTAGLAVMGCVLERNRDAVGKGYEKWMLEILKGGKEFGLTAKSETDHDKVEGKGPESVDDAPVVEETAGEGEWQQVAGEDQHE